jgi:hypothetical protein
MIVEALNQHIDLRVLGGDMLLLLLHPGEVLPVDAFEPAPTLGLGGLCCTRVPLELSASSKRL